MTWVVKKSGPHCAWWKLRQQAWLRTMDIIRYRPVAKYELQPVNHVLWSYKLLTFIKWRKFAHLIQYKIHYLIYQLAPVAYIDTAISAAEFDMTQRKQRFRCRYELHSLQALEPSSIWRDQEIWRGFGAWTIWQYRYDQYPWQDHVIVKRMNRCLLLQ